MEGIWATLVIVGPVVLLVALVAGWLLNRRSRVPMSVTEDATRQRRIEEDAEEKAQHLR